MLLWIIEHWNEIAAVVGTVLGLIGTVLGIKNKG